MPKTHLSNSKQKVRRASHFKKFQQRVDHLGFLSFIKRHGKSYMGIVNGEIIVTKKTRISVEKNLIKHFLYNHSI